MERILSVGDTFRHNYLDEIYMVIDFEGDSHLIIETMRESTGEILFAARKESEDMILRMLEADVFSFVEDADSDDSGWFNLLGNLW